MRERRYEKKRITTIGETQGDICIQGFPVVVVWEEKSITFLAEEAGVYRELYFNKTQVTKEMFGHAHSWKEGDYLSIGGVKLLLAPDAVTVQGEAEHYTTTLLELAPNGKEFEGFPKYKRSPRLIKQIPDKEIEISDPLEKAEMKKGSLLQMIVPALLMALVTAAMGLLMEQGMFMIMGLVTTLMTMIFSVTRYINEKKDCKIKNKKRIEVYETYLLNKRKELYKAQKAEEEAWKYNYPSLSQVEKLIADYSPRIYEKSFDDDDFLTVAIGKKRAQVSFPIKVSDHSLETEKDSLEIEAQEIKEAFAYIEDRPVVVDLKKAHMGLVGEKENIHEQLKLMVGSLTFAHSYHDLQIIAIFNKKYEEDFQWMKWYPHCKLQALNVRGLIHSEHMRDQVLGSLNQILKDRKLKKDENKKESRYKPHFLFLIDEPKLIMDHAIMEYLGKEGDALGFSIIYTTHMRANLPEYIGTVVMLEDSMKGTLLLNEKVLVEEPMDLNQIAQADLEWMARNLSVLSHAQGITSHIPESITFFEMFQIQHPEELDVEERWLINESHKTLAVPLGVRAKDEYVYLNLHENAHGPHGLVAGTTGSGKSEIVQSYILALAANFHPYEVGFLLIDYKGGGMAGLFRNLPHLMGTITNLDGSESKRAMASIKSELARRQRIFSANNVNHINAYNKLFKNGAVTEPIPHLFMISDEFAELKKEQPDFMAELVSTARIGRSLGIHLILATQKPTGVVDDQIWTNSKFKLCLKVQDEADSRELLKTGDAAFITQPGRAYLQVGNNEIYELFQSAWSGATYAEDGKKEMVDHRIYRINELGQGELLNKDLSTAATSNQIQATQLDVVVSHIQKVFQKEGVTPVRKPWLPSLKTKLISPATLCAEGSSIDLTIPLGMVDIPENQEQIEYVVNLKKEGNIGFFAAPGYGKTTFLSTVILSLALKNTVQTLNFYLLDLGNSALIPFDALPHTADYLTFDDEEKQQKFFRIIQEETKRRKKLLAEKMAQNFDVYNQIAKEPLKAIVIIVDNFDVVKELGFDADEEFTRISRDGAGLGIYLIFSASNEGNIRFATMNNIKVKIAGYLYDPTDANSLVGKSEYVLPEVGGRAFVKLSQTSVMQIYTMVDFANEVEYNANIKTRIAEITEQYPQERAPRIPVLPDTFPYSTMPQYGKSEKAGDILLGLNLRDVELTGMERFHSPFLIIGESGKGKTNMLRVILNQIAGTAQIYLFDSKSKGLYSYQQEPRVSYLQSEAEYDLFMQEMEELCMERRRQFEDALLEERVVTSREFYRSQEPYYVLFDNIDEFFDKIMEEHEDTISPLFDDMAEVGITIIMTAHGGKLRGYEDPYQWVKSAIYGLVLSDQGGTDVFSFNSFNDVPEFGYGQLFENGLYEKLKLPVCE